MEVRGTSVGQIWDMFNVELVFFLFDTHRAEEVFWEVAIIQQSIFMIVNVLFLSEYIWEMTAEMTLTLFPIWMIHLLFLSVDAIMDRSDYGTVDV